MSAALCRPVREYLSAIQSGSAPTPGPDVWDTLVRHNAVTGSSAAPSITPVGLHVLRELEVRAYRTDTLTLEVVAGQLDRVLNDLDQVAKTAEYFLAELGPVTPPDAVPFLRPVAVGLANRRETPEELAEQFRNVWGAVEVMGGTAPDRLMAAELINAAKAELSTIYAPMMSTITKIREATGGRSSAVTAAALLHLNAGADGVPALDTFYALQEPMGSDESAALLAGAFPDPAVAVARRDRVALALIAAGFLDGIDVRNAAAYMASGSGDPQALLARVPPIANGVKSRIPRAITAAAVLSDIQALQPAELLNWWQKACDITASWKLAPNDAELAALALSLVHGLPKGEFQTLPPEHSAASVDLRALLALHAWIYRPLVPILSGEPAPAA
ncbi:MAG: hypothetical protein L3K08_09225 [Thermoplasmata archaeon]|nr:hypothetical protein [Thermoplasmata archaeon]